jgi:hypothetical protein
MNKDEATSTCDEIMQLLDDMCSDSDLSTELVLELFEDIYSSLGTCISGLRHDMNMKILKQGS